MILLNTFDLTVSNQNSEQGDIVYKTIVHTIQISQHTFCEILQFFF